MIYTIPIDAAFSQSFVQETALDGVSYRLLLRWNERSEYWFLSLYDLEDVPIITSRKLVSGADLLRYCVDSDRRPQGVLSVTNTPSRYSLGVDDFLVYSDEAELKGV